MIRVLILTDLFLLQISQHLRCSNINGSVSLQDLLSSIDCFLLSSTICVYFLPFLLSHFFWSLSSSSFPDIFHLTTYWPIFSLKLHQGHPSPLFLCSRPVFLQVFCQKRDQGCKPSFGNPPY